MRLANFTIWKFSCQEENYKCLASYLAFNDSLMRPKTFFLRKMATVAKRLLLACLFQLKKANLNNMTGSLLHKMNDIVANITMNDDQHYDNSLISVLDQNALSSGSYSWKYS